MNRPPATDAPADPDGLHADLAGWFVRRGDPCWTPGDEQALTAWLDADPKRRQAWQRWLSDWQLMDELDAEARAGLRKLARADAAARRPTQATGQRSRRSWLSGVALAGVGALAVMAGLAVWRQEPPHPLYEQVTSTARGQQAELSLPDGSRVQLDTDTHLQVRYYRDRREVVLTGGQALFAVVRDPGRPFNVITGAVRVEVVGTRFAVRMTPDVPGRDGIEVGVEEGRVRVAPRDGTSRSGGPRPGFVSPFDLVAGQRAVFPANGGPAVIGRPAAEGVAPWRSRRLSFHDVPLAQVLAELERYGALRVAHLHPEVARLRLTATLDPHDAAAARRLLTAALPVTLLPGADGLRVLPAR